MGFSNENRKMKSEKIKVHQSKHKNQNYENEKGEIKMPKNLKPLKVGKLALEEYRGNTNGNMKLSKSEVAKKLTRNVHLSYPMPTEDESYKWYAYGHMRILVKNNKKIISVINRQPTIVGWELDYQKKIMLNKLLKIS